MKRLLLLSLLVFAVAAFGQDAPAEETAMEETVADTAMVEMAADSAMVDSMAMDMLMTDTTEVAEEAMEDEGDALEAMLAEEGTEMVAASGSQLIGYTVGVNVGYPVYMSAGLASGKPAPIFGVVVNTPYGFSAGPLDIGVGAELGMYDFTDVGEYKGFIALATLNTAVLNTPQGAVAAEVGGGYYGNSLGGTVGASFSYVIPNAPVVLNPYVRANLSLDGGSGTDGSVAWINAGLYVKVDISSFF